MIPPIKEFNAKYNGKVIVASHSEIQSITNQVNRGVLGIIKNFVPKVYLKEIIKFNEAFVEEYSGCTHFGENYNWARTDSNPKKSVTLRNFRISHIGNVDDIKDERFSNIKPLFIQLLKFQNKITNNNYSFYKPKNRYFVTPQILHYPANGGYLDTHTHPLLPQKIGMILCLKTSILSGGSTYFDINGDKVDTEQHHKSGDLLLFKYNQPHGVTEVGAKDCKTNFAVNNSRLSLIFPVKSH